MRDRLLRYDFCRSRLRPCETRTEEELRAEEEALGRTFEASSSADDSAGPSDGGD